MGSARVAICDSHKDCEPGQYCLQWPPGSWKRCMKFPPRFERDCSINKDLCKSGEECVETPTCLLCADCVCHYCRSKDECHREEDCKPGQFCDFLNSSGIMRDYLTGTCKEKGECRASFECKGKKEFCAEIDGKNKCVNVVDYTLHNGKCGPVIYL